MIHQEQAVIIEQIDDRNYWVKTDDGSIKKLSVLGKLYLVYRNLPIGQELTVVNNPYRPEEVLMAYSNRFKRL